MKTYFLIAILITGYSTDSQGQIRNKSTKYLEVSSGIPILFEDNNFPQNWQQGDRFHALSLCFGTATSNYHRIGFAYRQEKIQNNATSLKNYQLKYSYEATLLKGKYHLSYLGFLYGIGAGFQSLSSSIGNENSQGKAYPFLTIGFNVEKFFSPKIAIFASVHADGTTAAITRQIKANAQVGLKFKLFDAL
ncbi:hypothetical protein VB264_17335 [Arcicella aquatica]|uniref:Outer membrane protein beta-barrel domain-containing protein n=1 Tax=Arcicella aquatica TaxID=217141 RepID=A0ABU5QRQ5_9BACT|nr:hypothetical protein [Arcicella aquatica]MEA5259565.1 hypothetical protein [Arcicella aquatica]